MSEEVAMWKHAVRLYNMISELESVEGSGQENETERLIGSNTQTVHPASDQKEEAINVSVFGISVLGRHQNVTSHILQQTAGPSRLQQVFQRLLIMVGLATLHLSNDYSLLLYSTCMFLQ